MGNKTENQDTHPAHIEYTPNGGKIVRCGKFTFMDRAGLAHYWNTDPVCQEWELVDSLCDCRFLPFPELPASDPYNRPDYLTNLDGDTSWWTPHEAIRRYGCHLADDDTR